MKFEKISKEQFETDFVEAYLHGNLALALSEPDVDNKDLRAQAMADRAWFDLKLPKRATIGSAGYDFFYPLELRIPEGVTVLLPTGLAWNAKGGSKDDRFVLSIYPRSSLGSRYSLREPNLVSIIDSDYYGCEKNGGHIFMHLRNEGKNGTCIIKPNYAYAQGIITRYYITEDDDTVGVRQGGIGSTSIV